VENVGKVLYARQNASWEEQVKKKSAKFIRGGREEAV
jgi:hypothetical protein